MRDAERGIIKNLAERLWRVHPREIQDMGITRKQFYEREITKIVDAALVAERESCAVRIENAADRWIIDNPQDAKRLMNLATQLRIAP